MYSLSWGNSNDNINTDPDSSTEDSVTERRTTAVIATDTAVTVLSVIVWSSLKVTTTVTVKIVVTTQRWFLCFQLDGNSEVIQYQHMFTSFLKMIFLLDYFCLWRTWKKRE